MENSKTSVPRHKDHGLASLNTSKHVQHQSKAYPTPIITEKSSSIDPRKDDIANKLIRINHFEKWSTAIRSRGYGSSSISQPAVCARAPFIPRPLCAGGDGALASRPWQIGAAHFVAAGEP